MGEVLGVVTWRRQFCEGEFDISTQFGAESYADCVRFWAGAHGDFCLIEVTRTATDEWMPTGGDGAWVEFADWRFSTPDDAMATYAVSDPRYEYREAVCRCGQPGAECD